jgi:predicted esterase YcpF (UPF0227 family)
LVVLEQNQSTTQTHVFTTREVTPNHYFDKRREMKKERRYAVSGKTDTHLKNRKFQQWYECMEKRITTNVHAKHTNTQEREHGRD